MCAAVSTSSDTQEYPLCFVSEGGPETVSGSQSGRSHRPFEEGRCRCAVQPLCGSGQAELRQRRAESRGRQFGQAQATVSLDVLAGLFRAVFVVSAVIVMVMAVLLPVQNGVRQAFRMVVHHALTGHGNGLPEDRGQQERDDEEFAHGGNLTEAGRRVEPPKRRTLHPRVVSVRVGLHPRSKQEQVRGRDHQHR